MLSPEMVMGTLTGDDMWRPLFTARVDDNCGAGEKAEEVAIAEKRIREARMVALCWRIVLLGIGFDAIGCDVMA